MPMATPPRHERPEPASTGFRLWRERIRASRPRRGASVDPVPLDRPAQTAGALHDGGRRWADPEPEAAPRRVNAGPAPGHGRGKRAARAPIARSSWVLNGAAIAIAVMLAPVLTASSATTAALTASSSVAGTPEPSISWVPTDPRFSPAPGQQPLYDRSAQRDAVDADDTDDTLAAPPPRASVTPNGSQFVSPVPGAITGGFGMRFHPILHYWRMHNGVDMHAACGTPVVAAYRGTVVQAGRNGGYGNLVVIDLGVYQGKPTLTKYAHLSRIGVTVGQKVETGQGIALSGTTGLSTGCHLHFEVKVNGSYVDPSPYLTGKPSPRPSGTIPNLGPTTSPSPKAVATPSPSPSQTKSAKPTPSPSPSTKTPKPTPSPTPSKTPKPTPPPNTGPTPTPTPTPTSSEPSPTQTESAGRASNDPSPSDSSTP